MDIHNYGGGWVGLSPAVPPTAEQRRLMEPIVWYRAWLTGTRQLGLGEIAFRDDADGDELVAALNRRPDWMPYRWPETLVTTDADLRSLALLKILCVFSFGQTRPCNDPEEILAMVGTRYSEALRVAAGNATAIEVSGTVSRAGNAGGSVEPIAPVRPLPDNPVEAYERQAADLARADIIRLIHTLSPSWDPFAPASI